MRFSLSEVTPLHETLRKRESAMVAHKDLDRRDWRILGLLQSNGRLSVAEIARKIHLSAPAVKSRIQRLEDDGFITGYRAVVDYERLGYPVHCFVQVQGTPDRYKENIKAIQAIPEVVSCAHMTGDICLGLTLVARSVRHLEVILDQLSKLGATSTALILSHVVKDRPINASAADERLER